MQFKCHASVLYSIRNPGCLLVKGEQSSYIKITVAVWRMD